MDDSVVMIVFALIAVLVWHVMSNPLHHSSTNYGESREAVFEHPYEHL